MSPEELDEARAKEAQRLWESGQEAGSSSWVVAARLAREGWTPPEPVDPDLLAFREWASKEWPLGFGAALSGRMDTGGYAKAYIAGARMAREQERERAKVLLDYAWEDVGAPGGDEAKARSNRAFDIITKYEKGGQ